MGIPVKAHMTMKTWKCTQNHKHIWEHTCDAEHRNKDWNCDFIGIGDSSLRNLYHCQVAPSLQLIVLGCYWEVKPLAQCHKLVCVRVKSWTWVFLVNVLCTLSHCFSDLLDISNYNDPSFAHITLKFHMCLKYSNVLKLIVDMSNLLY